MNQLFVSLCLSFILYVQAQWVSQMDDVGLLLCSVQYILVQQYYIMRNLNNWCFVVVLHSNQAHSNANVIGVALYPDHKCPRVLQMQLERLLARQMEILQDAAVQERLQALDWRIPPAALKYLNDAQNTNGTTADTSRDNQGKKRAESDVYLLYPHSRYKCCYLHTLPRLKSTQQSFDLNPVFMKHIPLN